MYDHNQTLVPESFMALYVRHGRPVASREEVEQRHELAEDLALHIAAMPSMSAAEGETGQSEALEQCRAGLLTAPAQVSSEEACWIVQRVAELLGQETPRRP